MRKVLSGLVAALLVAGLCSATFVGGSAETTHTREHIRVLNSRFERAGRMGIGITNIDGFLLQNSYLGEINMPAIDLELDWSGATRRNIRILNNTFGRHRFAMFANDGQGVNESDVTIDGNTQSAAPVTCQPIIQISVTDNTFTNYPKAVLLVGTQNSGTTESGNRL